MGARRTARERALQALYQLELSEASAQDALETAWAAEDNAGREPESQSFALDIVNGVRGHLEEIDNLIQAHSHNWRIDRMSRIDRNVLRVGVWELKYRQDIPKKVSINESVELGKKFGTEESSAFINGLLDRIGVALGKT
jgi:transcription antitermination protein NusB